MAWIDFLKGGKSEDHEMGFFDHIEELRWHIIRSLIAITIITIVCFIKYDWLFEYVIFAPIKENFITYKLLCQLGAFLHVDGLCMTVSNFKLVNLELSGQFMIQMTTAFTAGIIIAFPYIFYELWSFVKPGLHAREVKKTQTLMFYVSGLFFTGILFGYYLMTPFSVAFFQSYSISDKIENTFTLDNYISTVTTTVLSCGLIFELPVLIYFLSKFGVMTPKFMRNYRRHAYVVIIILAAVITPQTDMISLAMITIPLIMLYEASITISARVEKERIAKDQEASLLAD